MLTNTVPHTPYSLCPQTINVQVTHWSFIKLCILSRISFNRAGKLIQIHVHMYITIPHTVYNWRRFSLAWAWISTLMGPFLLKMPTHNLHLWLSTCTYKYLHVIHTVIYKIYSARIYDLHVYNYLSILYL